MYWVKQLDIVESEHEKLCKIYTCNIDKLIFVNNLFRNFCILNSQRPNFQREVKCTYSNLGLNWRGQFSRTGIQSLPKIEVSPLLSQSSGYQTLVEEEDMGITDISACHPLSEGKAGEERCPVFVTVTLHVESKQEMSSSLQQMVLSLGNTLEPVEATEKGRCLKEANWLFLSGFAKVLTSLLRLSRNFSS